MKKHFIILLPLLAAACTKQSSDVSTREKGLSGDTTTPVCIRSLITTLQQAPVQNPPAEVYAYQYRGQSHYYVTSPCCDFFNFLYDSACQVICAPDGGIAGNGDGRCSDFQSSSSGRRLIWKDPR